MRELNGDGCTALASQIIILAAKDYRRALRMLKKNPGNRTAMKLAMECEEFFAGEWMKVLTDADGEWIKNRIRREVSGS